ncbi:hypothetical protein GL272_22185 [Aeromonas veronii]|uniref:hypothetical protein n=1 Tax=Aeromonas veronii TaxID=654 RepID=UPI001C5AA739|nr:hypothetical protein [Aeromonas veronii]MBW3779583.1 hypothetical protein [Aeromonas veronii]
MKMRRQHGFFEISIMTMAAMMAALMIVSVSYLSWISKEGDGERAKYETEMLFFAIEGFYYSHCKGAASTPTVPLLEQEGFLKPDNISLISNSIISMSFKNETTLPAGEVIFNPAYLPNNGLYLNKYWRVVKSGGNYVAEKQFGNISSTQYGYDQLFTKECGK